MIFILSSINPLFSNISLNSLINFFDGINDSFDSLFFNILLIFNFVFPYIINFILNYKIKLLFIKKLFNC